MERLSGTRVHTLEQLLELLDGVVAGSERGDRSDRAAGEYWAELLSTPGHPLATQLPDEALVDWDERGLLGKLGGARVLDIGCGGGRNSRWFAERGATVDGIDLAGPLLAQVAPTMPRSVTLTALDVLRDPLPAKEFDVVFDSGCFHHIAPHRRLTYLERVLPALRPGGLFGIVAFAAEAGELETPDDVQVIRSGDTAGGMAFSREELRQIFAPLEAIEVRAVRTGRDGAFAADFLNAGLFRSI